jgi:hypothetical protein
MFLLLINEWRSPKVSEDNKSQGLPFSAYSCAHLQNLLFSINQTNAFAIAKVVTYLQLKINVKIGPLSGWKYE